MRIEADRALKKSFWGGGRGGWVGVGVLGYSRRGAY